MTYEYECKDCGISFELSDKKPEDKTAPCPVCGEERPRIISLPAARQWKKR